MAGCLRKQHITTCSINWFITWKLDTKSRATLTPYFHCQLVEKSWWAQRSLNAKSHCHQPEDLNCQWILLRCRVIAHTQQMIKNIKQTLTLDTDCITFANTVLQLLGSELIWTDVRNNSPGPTAVDALWIPGQCCRCTVCCITSCAKCQAPAVHLSDPCCN